MRPLAFLIRLLSPRYCPPEPKPTPEQVEKARKAMEEIHGDSGLLRRRL
jgi:hypothetical protein